MAQVNSSAGQNQAFGSVAVASSAASAGAQDSQNKAAAVVVPYSQSEPGKHDPKRS